MRLIDADALLDKYPDCRGLREKVKAAPTVRNARFGFWSWCPDTERYDCNLCTYETLTKHHFCPNCGADMRGV